MKGTEPREVTLAPEVMPVLNLFASGVEDRFFQGWETFSRGVAIAAVAAQTSNFRLRNPTGSNVIAVLESIIFAEGAADRFFLDYQPETANLAGATGPTALDPRGRPNPTCLLSTGNNVAAVTPILDVQVLANTPYQVVVFEHQEIPLLPGRQMTGATNAVNVQLLATIRWRERFLEESERT